MNFKLMSCKNSRDKSHIIVNILGIKIKFKRKVNLKFQKGYVKNYYHEQTINKPKLKINNKRQPFVNIFIPQIHKNILTAGPLGILFFGKYLAEQKINVRFLCSPENYAPNDLKNIKDLDYILTHCKFETFNENSVIEISEKDINVATFWSTAYIASYIQQHCNSRKFIYLIQDYEKIFYPNSFTAALAENTYDLDYLPIFSTDILKDFFFKNNIGKLNDKKSEFTVFNTAASSYLPNFDTFCKREKKKKFVFYGRPNNPRNCYEMGMNVIKKLIDNKILQPSEWDFYSVGNMVGRTYFQDDVYIEELPYVSVDDYKKNLYSYDLCLSLMMSPHPSMVPIDMALSGVPVVTNIYKNKTKKSLKEISKNIYSTKLNEDDLYNEIKDVLKCTNNLKERYNNANSYYPNNWDFCFASNMENIIEYIRNIHLVN